LLRWLGVAGLFALGLAAKPMLVTLPCVLLLLDAWPLGRLGSAAAVRRAVLEKLPLLALSAAASVATVRAQAGAGALDAVEVPLAWRAANALASYGAYLQKTFWPLDLAVIYPHPGAEVPLASVAAGAATVAVVSLAAALQWRRRPWLGVGWLWYLGMLVPVIGLLQVGTQALADRYMYLPLAGVLVAVAFTGAELARRGGAARAAVGVLAGIALLACAGLARRQLAFWESDVALYTRALAVTEDNARAHNGLGLALVAEGRDAEARAELEAALALDSELDDAHVNLGVVLLRLGEPEAAIPELGHGLDFAPERRVAVHARLGAALLAAGRPEAALDEARQGLVLDSEAGLLHAVVGMAQVRLGRDDLGLMALERAESLGVDEAGVHATLGEVLARRGRRAEAAERYRQALARAPDDPGAANNLAWILATDPALRDPAEAVRLAEHAAEAAPGQASVLDTLAVAYHAAGRREDALAAAARAARAARAASNAPLAREIEARSAGW
ncbi:MAG TPA: tetratricopeptide repeat protein, partial [Myxococcota bacterium]|nr:tetratricopeptide repeat protein [Myxococcota bacterium]